MEISLIVGSQRQRSGSRRVADCLAHRLTSLGLVDATTTVDLAAQPFALWDEEHHYKTPQWHAASNDLTRSEGFVVVVPEWNGMAPPALKNFFQIFGYTELGNKPALLVAVSSSVNGAYPIAELRMSSYKNCRICYIPEQLIIRSVGSALSSEEPAVLRDERLQARVDDTLRLLCHYARALRTVREATPTPPYYGM